MIVSSILELMTALAFSKVLRTSFSEEVQTTLLMGLKVILMKMDTTMVSKLNIYELTHLIS